jgi:hypothetical protein
MHRSAFIVAIGLILLTCKFARSDEPAQSGAAPNDVATVEQIRGGMPQSLRDRLHSFAGHHQS